MSELNQDALYITALQTIGAAAKIPLVRVDREAFLRKHFAESAHLDVVLERGPQAVYSTDALRKKATSIIKTSVTKTSAASFATGLPGTPVTMVAAGGADLVQYFGFAINLAQQIAYLFGEDDLFDGGDELPDAAQVRVIAYLGAMFGVAGAASLIAQTSKVAGHDLDEKIAAETLPLTSWYPLLRKVGTLVGQKVTKTTVEKTITKAVPIFGGVVSGGLTYVTFRPMGDRLADALVATATGEVRDDLELNPEFAASLKDDATDDRVGDAGAAASAQSST